MKEYTELNENRTWAGTLGLALLFLLSAFIGVGVYSQSTSPFFRDFGYDSAMFQTMGKYWTMGYLPYLDLYDHKGPAIFLINALGYALSGREGVFILQVLNIALCQWIAYRLMRRDFGEALSLTASLLLPLALAVNWQEGNTTEEYILPLLFLSFYFMRCWLEKAEAGDFEHSPKAAFIYGLAFSFALMTRLTNALAVCLGTAFISFALMLRGCWRNLGKNALAFFIGGGNSAPHIQHLFCLERWALRDVVWHAAV